MTTRREREVDGLPPDILDLLTRRAERLRKPEAAVAAEEEVLWIATFALGGEEYAIPLAVLRAVMPLRAVTPVPRSSRVVVGIVQFEGAIVAALSTAALLDASSKWDPTILLVVDCADEGHSVALDCAQVPLAMTIPASRYIEAAASTDRPAAGVYVPGRGMVWVIDVARLLAVQDWRGLDGRP